jgi:UDP-glucose 4-epimerase
MANVLVTGGSGLIGWRATELLLQQGHRVIVFDLKPDSANLAPLVGDLSVVQGDISDPARLTSVMRAEAIDHVLHLAAYISHQSNADPAGAFRVNTIGTANVFDAALAVGVERVCWASTVMAVGGGPDDGLPQGPQVVYAPRLPYGVAKYATEVMAESYAELLGLDVVGIRPPTAYGIGRLVGGTGDLVNDPVRRVAVGEPTVLHGSLTRPNEMIYNRDMARLFVMALLAEGPLPARIYNTPVESRYTIDQVADVLHELVPDADIDIASYPDVPGLPPLLDGSAATRDIGFTPEYSLAAGFAEMIAHFAAEGRR